MSSREEVVVLQQSKYALTRVVSSDSNHPRSGGWVRAPRIAVGIYVRAGV